MPENKQDNSWVDMNKLSTESDAFMTVDDLKADLSSALEELPNASSVRSQALATTFYTAGDTQNPGFQQIEESLLSLPPSRVSRRYAPIKDGEFNASRPPDPMFINAAARKPEEAGDKFLYPQPVFRPESLEGLEREKQANEPVTDAASSAFFKDEADMPLDPRAMAFAKFRGAKVSKDRPASFSLSNAVTEGSAEESADFNAQPRTLSSNTAPVVVERVAEPSLQNSQANTPSLEVDLPPIVKSLVDKRRRDAENATRNVAKNTPPSQRARPQEVAASEFGVSLDDLMGPSRPRGVAQKPAATEDQSFPKPTEGQADPSDVKKNSDAPIDFEQAAESGLFGNSLLEGVDLSAESSLLSSSVEDAAPLSSSYSAEDVDTFFEMALNQLSQEDDSLGAVEAYSAVENPAEASVNLVSSTPLATDGATNSNSDAEPAAFTEYADSLSGVADDVFPASDVVDRAENIEAVLIEAGYLDATVAYEDLSESAEPSKTSGADLYTIEAEEAQEALIVSSKTSSESVTESEFFFETEDKSTPEEDFSLEAGGPVDNFLEAALDVAPVAADLEVPIATNATVDLEALLDDLSAESVVAGLPDASQEEQGRSLEVIAQEGESLPEKADLSSGEFEFRQTEQVSEASVEGPIQQALAESAAQSGPDIDGESEGTPSSSADSVDGLAQDPGTSDILLPYEESSAEQILEESSLSTETALNPALLTRNDQEDLFSAAAENGVADQGDKTPLISSISEDTLSQDAIDELTERSLLGDSRTVSLAPDSTPSADKPKNTDSPNLTQQSEFFKGSSDTEEGSDASDATNKLRLSEQTGTLGVDSIVRDSESLDAVMPDESASSAPIMTESALQTASASRDETGRGEQSLNESINLFSDRDDGLEASARVVSGASPLSPEGDIAETILQSDSILAAFISEGASNSDYFDADGPDEDGQPSPIASSLSAAEYPGVGEPGNNSAKVKADSPNNAGESYLSGQSETVGVPDSLSELDVTPTTVPQDESASIVASDLDLTTSKALEASNATPGESTIAMSVMPGLAAGQVGLDSESVESTSAAATFSGISAGTSVAPAARNAGKPESPSTGSSAPSSADTESVGNPLRSIVTSTGRLINRLTGKFRRDGANLTNAPVNSPGNVELVTSARGIAAAKAETNAPSADQGSSSAADLPASSPFGSESSENQQAIRTAPREFALDDTGSIFDITTRAKPAMVEEPEPMRVSDPRVSPERLLQTSDTPEMAAISITEQAISTQALFVDTADSERAVAAETIGLEDSDTSFLSETEANRTLRAAPNILDSAVQDDGNFADKDDRNITDPVASLDSFGERETEPRSSEPFEKSNKDAEAGRLAKADTGADSDDRQKDTTRQPGQITPYNTSTAEATASEINAISQDVSFSEGILSEATLATNPEPQELQISSAPASLRDSEILPFDVTQDLRGDRIAPQEKDSEDTTTQRSISVSNQSSGLQDATLPQGVKISEALSAAESSRKQVAASIQPGVNSDNSLADLSAKPPLKSNADNASLIAAYGESALLMESSSPMAEDASENAENFASTPTASIDQRAKQLGRGVTNLDLPAFEEEASTGSDVLISKKKASESSVLSVDAAYSEAQLETSLSAAAVPDDRLIAAPESDEARISKSEPTSSVLDATRASAFESDSALFAVDEMASGTALTKVQETLLQTTLGTAFSPQDTETAAGLTAPEEADIASETEISSQGKFSAISEDPARYGERTDTDGAASPQASDQSSAGTQIPSNSEESSMASLVSAPEAAKNFPETALDTTAAVAVSSPAPREEKAGSTVSVGASVVSDSPYRSQPIRYDNESESGPKMGPSNIRENLKSDQARESVDQSVRTDVAPRAEEKSAQPFLSAAVTLERSNPAANVDDLIILEDSARTVQIPAPIAVSIEQTADSGLLESALVTDVATDSPRIIQEQNLDQSSASEGSSSVLQGDQGDVTGQASRIVTPSLAPVESAAPETNIISQDSAAVGRSLSEAALTTSTVAPNAPQGLQMPSPIMTPRESEATSPDVSQKVRVERIQSRQSENTTTPVSFNSGLENKNRPTQDTSASLRPDDSGVASASSGPQQQTTISRQFAFKPGSDTEFDLGTATGEMSEGILSELSIGLNIEGEKTAAAYGEITLLTEPESPYTEAGAGVVDALSPIPSSFPNERVADTSLGAASAVDNILLVSEEASVGFSDSLALGKSVLDPTSPSAAASDATPEAPLSMEFTPGVRRPGESLESSVARTSALDEVVTAANAARVPSLEYNTVFGIETEASISDDFSPSLFEAQEAFLRTDYPGAYSSSSKEASELEYGRSSEFRQEQAGVDKRARFDQGPDSIAYTTERQSGAVPIDQNISESVRLFDQQAGSGLATPLSMDDAFAGGTAQEQPIVMRSDVQPESSVASPPYADLKISDSPREDVSVPIISLPKAQERAAEYADGEYISDESFSLADAIQPASQQLVSLLETPVAGDSSRRSLVDLRSYTNDSDVLSRLVPGDSSSAKSRKQSRPTEQSIRTETVYRLQEETVVEKTSRQASSNQESSASRVTQAEENVDPASMSMEERLEVMIRRERVRIQNEYNTKEDNSKIALKRAESRIRESVSKALPPRLDLKENPRSSSRAQALASSYKTPEISSSNNTANPSRVEETTRQVSRQNASPKEQFVTIRDVEYLREQQQVDEVLLRQQIKRELRLETEERIAKSNLEQEIKMKRKMRSMIDKFLNS